MKTFNCIIIDDDEIDLLLMISIVKRFPQLNLVGAFQDGEKALSVIEKEKIDILFLDIDMPAISGLDLRKKAMEVPVCIFITSHPEHAVESFELETLDFIVKPLKFERFRATIDRIEEFLEIRHKADLFEASIGGDVVYIKEGYQQTKIKLHDILYLEALKDYTLIITEEKRHCVLNSIGNLLKESHFQSFIRIHRSFAIQKQFVQNISSQEVKLKNNVIIPIGRSYKENLSLLL